jgi:hypothetical protein
LKKDWTQISHGQLEELRTDSNTKNTGQKLSAVYLFITDLHLNYNILLVLMPATFIYHHRMMNMPARKPVPFDQPGTYRIKVLGQIDQTWSDYLQGLAICQVVEEANSPVTILEGELSDQAALVGVLNTLYELHLTVVSVERQST